MNKNTLTLRKCAYIFDSTHTTYRRGTVEQIKKERAIEAALKDYYDHPEKLAVEIPYTTDAAGNIYININGDAHRLNALQIQTLNGEPGNVINHRRHIDTAAIIERAPHFHQWTKDSIYSNKYRTLHFEFFTGLDELGYIRIHFKNYWITFVIDDRTGTPYTAGEYGNHKPTTTAAILDRLGIESAAAKKEFFEIMDIITEV